METKYYLMFLVLLLSFVFSEKIFAQKCLVFSYDADGNRVSRAVDYDCFGKDEYEDVQEIAVEEGIRVYPNPTNACFTIVVPDFSETTSAIYELYDFNGMVIIKDDLNNIETRVDIENLNIGVYLLKIFIGDEMFYKIILKR